MSHLLDGKTDAEIEDIYRKATMDDLQNLLNQEKVLSRRRILRKVMRLKQSKLTSDTENSPPSIKFKEIIPVEIEKEITKSTNQINYNSVLNISNSQTSEKLQELKKELHDTVDLTRRKQLRKDINELEKSNSNTFPTESKPIIETDKLPESNINLLSLNESKNSNKKIDSKISNNLSKSETSNLSCPTSTMENNPLSKLKANVVTSNETIASQNKIGGKTASNFSLNEKPRLENSSLINNREKDQLLTKKTNAELINETIASQNKTNSKMLSNLSVNETPNIKSKSPINITEKETIMKSNKNIISPDKEISHMKTFPSPSVVETSKIKSSNPSSAIDIKKSNDSSLTLETAIPKNQDQNISTKVTQSPVLISKSDTIFNKSNIMKKTTDEKPETPKVNISRVSSVREKFETPTIPSATKKPLTTKSMTDDEINNLVNAAMKKDGSSRGPTPDKNLNVQEAKGRKISTPVTPVTRDKTNKTSNHSKTKLKDLLLVWTQMNTKEYQNVKINNYSKCWADGLAFCALIHHFYPNSFDYKALSSKNPLANFKLAFDTAKNCAGIEPLIDPEDMMALESPDEKCVYTYVQFMYNALKQHPKNMLKRSETPSG